jgi:hypothetical protein
MDDFGRQIGELREEMHTGFKEMRAEIGGLRGEVRAEISGLRGEMGGLRGEMHDGFKQIRDEINTRFFSVERSITMIWVSLTGGMAGFVAALIATNL